MQNEQLVAGMRVIKALVDSTASGVDQGAAFAEAAAVFDPEYAEALPQNVLEFVVAVASAGTLALQQAGQRYGFEVADVVDELISRLNVVAEIDRVEAQWPAE